MCQLQLQLQKICKQTEATAHLTGEELVIFEWKTRFEQIKNLRTSFLVHQLLLFYLYRQKRKRWKAMRTIPNDKVFLIDISSDVGNDREKRIDCS
jgi:hypothetical protein